MKHNNLFTLLLIFPLVCYVGILKAQDVSSYSLQQLKDSALKNNHILAIKDWQIKEKKTKIKEDEVKRYPVVNLNANYEYTFNLGDLTIPPGTIGELPLSATNIVQLPNTDKSFKVGSHNNYNIGIVAYQPITQQAKIETGLQVDKMDAMLTQTEKSKISLQLEEQVEQLYYGILIAQKQLAEANAKLALGRAKLADVENALFAGKTVVANRAGLQANVADEEQNILKLNIQVQDYLGDLISLAEINAATIKLEETGQAIKAEDTAADYKKDAIINNPDLQIATINRSKVLLGIKAVKQSIRPDVGLVAGYAYQLGNPVLPSNNPFVGVNVKWNLQDIFSNRHLIKQREFQLKQAEESILNTQQQVNNNIEKAHRKIDQSKALLTVALKAVTYRREAMKLEEDKQAAGLNVKTDLLNTSSLLAKAEADMYAARLSYSLAVSGLQYLVGNK